MPRSLRALVPVAVTTLAVLGLGLSVVDAPAATASGPTAATSTVAARPAPPSRGLLYGTHTPATAQATQPQTIAALESRIGRTTGINRSYTYWDDAQPSSTLTQDLALGRVPLLSIQPRSRSGVVVPWADIASGAVDDAIRRQATSLGAVPGGVILALHHEADIAVGYGTSAEYVAAYRHYVSVFRSVGASNVVFAWVLTPHTFKATADAWYPGDDVVDWIGADAYNAGGCKPGVTGWRSMQEVASAFYQWGSAHGKPLVLAEYGSAADPGDPTRRAQWLRETDATFRSWPNLRAVAYFDSIGTCDWRLAPDEAASTAFRDLSRGAFANGAPSAWLRATTPVGPAPMSETFDLSRSTGADYATGRGVSSWTLDFGDGSTPATGVGNPSSVTHVYPVGTFTATLRVVGGTGGRTNSARTTVTSAGVPTIAQGEAKSVTTTGAALPGWIGTSGLPGTYQVQWGTTTALGTTEDRGTMSPVATVQARTETVGGLAPGTRYYWRYVATTPAGTTYGPTRWFTTTP
jgi:hypothetical protein